MVLQKLLLVLSRVKSHSRLHLLLIPGFAIEPFVVVGDMQLGIIFYFVFFVTFTLFDHWLLTFTQGAFWLRWLRLVFVVESSCLRHVLSLVESHVVLIIVLLVVVWHEGLTLTIVKLRIRVGCSCAAGWRL